jgi:hypothetical protein
MALNGKSREHIVDAAGRRPDEKQAARSQIEFSDRAQNEM